MSKHRTRPRIFVQIPSYRDRECQWTLRDMFERARHPDRVFAGVCWQTVPEEDADCFQARPRPQQVRTVEFHIDDARGLRWARGKAQTLWRGEEFTLQIDSHMRFVDDWDERMIDMLALCGSPDPVLTVYPASYDPPDQREHSPRPQVQTVKGFLPSGLLQFHTGTVPEEVAMDRPFATAALAGGFVFGSFRIITDVPSDPEVYFLGEEPNLAVRLWTAGFDLFSPHETLLYHYYLRKDGSRLWDDATSRATKLLHDRTMRRMRLLCEPDAFPADELAELGAFGLGRRRSLQAYEAFAGLNFASQTLTSAARAYPWVRQPGARSPSALPDTLLPAPGTQLFLLGEDGVLFCEAKGTMQRLNPAAAVIWCALADGRGWNRIARDTAAARGIGIETAWAELHDLALHWTGEGLLHDAALEHVHAPRIDPEGFDFRSRYYRLLDSVVQVRFGDAALELLIHPALAHLEVERAGSIVTSPMLSVLRILEWYYVIGAGQGVMGPPATLRKLVPRIKAEILARALARRDHVLHLHAAAVMHAGSLVLLPGMSGSGKTTLIVAARRWSGFTPTRSVTCSTRATSRSSSRRAFGRRLVVGLVSDHDASTYKQAPVMTFEERHAVVSACRHVDRVLDTPAPLHCTCPLLDEIGAAVCCHGDDMTAEQLRFWYGDLIPHGPAADRSLHGEHLDAADPATCARTWTSLTHRRARDRRVGASSSRPGRGWRAGRHGYLASGGIGHDRAAEILPEGPLLHVAPVGGLLEIAPALVMLVEDGQRLFRLPQSCALEYDGAAWEYDVPLR